MTSTSRAARNTSSGSWWSACACCRASSRRKEAIRALEPRVERLRELLFKRFSVPLSPYILTLAELRHKHQQELPLIREILKEGRTIHGKDIKELLS